MPKRGEENASNAAVYGERVGLMVSIMLIVNARNDGIYVINAVQ